MRIHKLLGVVAALAVISTTACLSGESTSATVTDWSKVTFDPSLHINLDSMTKTVGNVYYRDSTAGTGNTVVPGTLVSTRYTGWLAATGVQFTSNLADAAPYQFPLGEGFVIPGWDDGLVGMRVGGTRLLVIPPEMGYGSGGSADGTIPGNAVLVFLVTVTSSP